MVSHESIYKLIWKNKRENGILWTYLRHKGKKYHKRKGETSGRDLISNRVDIEERPKIVEMKARIGDWEGANQAPFKQKTPTNLLWAPIFFQAICDQGNHLRC